jgi:SAM-dependent methyltransferase
MARQCSIDARPGPLGRTVSAQAARPHGPVGRALGHLWVRETAAINDRAIELLGPVPGSRVLEVGCGPGRAVAELARRGAQVVGIDPSPVMIAQARQRNRAAVTAGQVNLLVGAVGSLHETLSGDVDAVLAIHTIYFWPDLSLGLAELHGVLAPGGRIAIGFRPAERGRPRRLDPAIYRIPTTARLTEDLAAAGFVDMQVHDAGSAAIVTARTSG